MSDVNVPFDGGVPIDFDPFAGPVVEAGAPSTEAQREIWLALKLDPDARAAFNESVALQLSGDLNRDALQGALSDLISHHDALRAVFSDDGLSIAFATPFDPPLSFHDLSSLSENEWCTRTDAILRENVSAPFDMRVGPLIRFLLLKRSESSHLLVITAHHIICDGWSMGVLVKDCGEAYTARTQGASWTRPLQTSFATYARERASFESSPDRNSSLSYWEGVLKNPPEPLELPYTHSRPAIRTYLSERSDITIPPELLRGMKSAASQLHVTFATFFLSAIGGFIHRITGQSDFIVGVPAAEQAILGQHRLVGHCANLLPIRFTLSSTTQFSSLLASISLAVSQGFEHSRVSLGAILERLHLPRDPSRAPLVAVMCNVDRAPSAKDCSFKGLSVGYSTVPRTSENFEWFVNALDTPDGLYLSVQFNSDLFSRESVEHLIGCFESFLSHLVTEPHTTLGAVPLLSEEARALLRKWNETDRVFTYPPEVTSIPSLIFDRPDFSPSQIAVEDSAGAVTYAELEAQSRAIAHALRTRGISEGAFIGIMTHRSRELPGMLLGVLRSGAAYVPLDPALPEERLRHMTSDITLSLILTDGIWAERASRLGEAVRYDEFPALEDLPSRIPSISDTDSPAYAIFTSGSTGKPKAVSVPHRAATNFLQSVAERPGLSRTDRMLALTTISFDISVLEIFLPLTVGATVVIVSSETATDPSAIESVIKDSRITVAQATPSTWRMLIENGWKGQDGLKALSGGEPLSTERARDLYHRVSELWNMYGPTETTVWSSCAKYIENSALTIGTPIANTQLFVCDDQGAHVPVGTKGELCIAGMGLALGYHNRPDLTHDKFVIREDPLGTPVRMYRTGDQARWNLNGEVEIFGRRDSQVKVRGFRIELGEIESAIRTHPAIADATAIVREDQPGDQRIVAYIVTRAPETVTATEVRGYLRETLPDYMLPQHVVELASLPLTSSGKIDRKALPPPFEIREQRTRQPPRTSQESLIAEVWSSLLKKEELDIRDNFFSIGGHSLLSLQAISAIERRTGYSIPVRSMLLKSLQEIAEEFPAPPEQIEPPPQSVGLSEKLRSFFRRGA